MNHTGNLTVRDWIKSEQVFGTSKTEVKGRSEESYTADLCQFIMTRRAFLKIKHLKIHILQFPKLDLELKVYPHFKDARRAFSNGAWTTQCVSHTVACDSLMSRVG